MKELSTGKTMTLKEVAEATGAAYSTIAAYAQKAGWTQNGKTTLITEAQVTVILEAMKQAHNGGRKFGGGGANLPNNLEGINTAKSRALRIDLLHRQIEAEMQGEINELKAENRSLAAEMQGTKNLIAERETGLSMIQRIAEAGWLVLSGRDDLLAQYRGLP
jgi:hypothetical protein